MEVDPLPILRQKVEEYPTHTAAAKALGISKQYLSNILRRRCDIGPRVLRKLGLKRAILARGSR